MPIRFPRQTIPIQLSMNTIIRAAILSHLKLSTISDTFLQRDSEFARYRSSMYGDIAKLCAKLWLERHGFTVTDWDDVRTNWRSSRKQFDLKVNDCRIEIASSIEVLDNLETRAALSKVLNEKSIIQPVRKTPKDVILQIYYLSDSNPQVNIMGWAEWDDLSQYQTIRYIAGHPRDFWLMPFSAPEARPPQDIISFLASWQL